ncbi:winged helix-turn-helix domain-containing protein [Streptomyces sp. HB132]|uniref:winged helix-turn-helix domain-containing protein n=1 Tax=Streptomyces sp. HB132 TaxID=767388 RepID=UPI0035A9305F
MGKNLKRWGLTFQRPEKRAGEQNPEAVRAWHEETWPAIRARAKADDGEILSLTRSGSFRTRSPAAPSTVDQKAPGRTGCDPGPPAARRPAQPPTEPDVHPRAHSAARTTAHPACRPATSPTSCPRP